jgi:hypothetical protein
MTVAQEVKVGTLVAIPLAPAIDRPIGIIFKRGRPFTLTARRFVELLQGAAAPVGIHEDEPDERSSSSS